MKAQDTLEKIRKGATASLKMGKIVEAVAELEGWSFEAQVLTLRRVADFRMGNSVDEVMNPAMFHCGTRKEVEEKRAAVLDQPGTVVLQENGTYELHDGEMTLGAHYYHDVSDITKGPHGCYFFAVDWVCVKADRFTAPNGDVFDNYYPVDKAKRSAPVSYRFWGWAKNHGMVEQVCAKLGLPTVEEEKRERDFKARDITNTGTCPCCGRNIKLDSSGKMVHHGFRRPGDGMGIIGDCFGVGYEPFEISPKGTMDLRSSLERRKDALVVRHGLLKAGKVESLTIHIGRKLEAITPTSDRWDRAHAAALAGTESAIRSLKGSIAFLQQSIDGWEPDDLPEVKARARGWRPATQWADSLQDDFSTIQ